LGILHRKANPPRLIAAFASCALIVLGLGLGSVPALALQSTGDGSWVWQNPLPEGNTLWDISCPGPDTCVAVEGAGGALRSTDSGATWTWTASGAKILYSVSCFDLTTCYAVGDNGAIVKTTNGTSWTTQSSGTIALLHDVSCPSATTCFAVGLGASLRTTNGGTTWTFMTGGAGNGVSCPTTTVCYAVTPSGAISGTTDGGTTWTVQNSGSPNEYFINISCPTTTTCFAVSGQGNIFQTSNGGTTWHNQVTPGSYPFLYSVSCVSALSCFATGGGVILSTSNGGTTWTSTSNFTWGLLAISCAPAPATTCYAAGGSNLVLRTTDGGTTWSHLRPTGLTQYLSGVSCPSSHTCFTVGQAGTIMATTNGGSTWSTQTFATTQWLRTVSCPDVSTCFAAGTNGLIIGTSNGGTSWAQKASIAGDIFFTGISCPSPSQCTAVGSAGNIRATTNGGTTWVAQTSNTTQSLWSISCTSSQVCRAVGDAGTILATGNGGTTWTAQTSGTTGSLNSITCPTVSTCYVVGAGTTPYTTEANILSNRDGGSSWSIQTISGVSLSGISCRTDLACFAVGGENFSQLGALTTILGTTDGSTWTKVNVGATIPLLAVACPSSCWAVGSGGTILAGPVGVVDPAGSSVVANPPFVLANGTAASSVLVTVKDTAGNPVSGKTVSLAKIAGPGSPNITPPTGTTNSAGQVVFTVASSTVGRDTFRATDTTDSIALAQTDVTFTGPLRVVLPALANAAYGGYVTSVYVQNLGTTSATLAIEYFDQAGDFVGSGDVNSNLPSHAGWTVRQDNSHSFPAGAAGSALLFSDQPVAAFVNEFAPGNLGDATSYSGVQVPSGVGTTLYAPTIVNNAYGGYTTGIGLLNEGTSPTDVTITYRNGSGTVINTQTVSNLAAHAYRGLYSGDATLALPSGFAGTATITNSAAQPLGAIVNETGPGGQFSSYDAVPSGSTTLYAPAALNNAFGGYNTGMGIVNTTGSAGSVTITYYDATGTATTTTHPIAANGSLGVYQGTDIATMGAYTATITSTVAIAAIVNEVAPSSTSAMQSTSYNTFSSGAAILNLPLVENAGSDPWNTGEGIMNTGTGPTTVTVNYFDASTGAAVGTPQMLTLAANAFWGLYQPAGGLPSGTRATAVITASSGGQVAVICNESSSTTFMSYDGQ
jgi:photosystem II stability/assembly factor-like uncharacterized protein